MGRLRIIFAAVAMAAMPVAAPADGLLEGLLGNSLWADRQGMTRADRALRDAIYASDFIAAEKALKDGARPLLPDLPDTITPRDPLYLAVDSFNRLQSKNRENTYRIIERLLEEGAVPTANTIATLLEAYPSQLAFPMDDAALAHYDPVFRAADAVFAHADKALLPGDYTRLLFGHADYNLGFMACDKIKIEKMLIRKANPNDVQGLVHSSKSGGHFYTSLPLHSCLRAYHDALEATKTGNPAALDVTYSAREQDFLRQSIEILLDYGADPNLLLQERGNLFSQDVDSRNAPTEHIYVVEPEIRQLLERILDKRASRGLLLPAP